MTFYLFPLLILVQESGDGNNTQEQGVFCYRKELCEMVRSLPLTSNCGSFALLHAPPCLGPPAIICRREEYPFEDLVDILLDTADDNDNIMGCDNVGVVAMCNV